MSFNDSNKITARLVLRHESIGTNRYSIRNTSPTRQSPKSWSPFPLRDCLRAAGLFRLWDAPSYIMGSNTLSTQSSRSAVESTVETLFPIEPRNNSKVHNKA